MADKSITKTELVASIASATGQSQATVSGVLDALFSSVSDAVAKGSKVSIPGWISFEQVATAARTGRNPQTGAEIKIPAGKRVKRLSLLSGGERSLTAVALLVAIFTARPSPFYVLDEVEAALDDANLRRLLVVLEELRAKVYPDLLPYSRPASSVSAVRARYDRIRSIAARVQA